MFPRIAERRALPKIAEEFEGARILQYWDDRRIVGQEFRERVLRDFEGETAWDVWVLFDDQATWDTAGDHVIDWGYTVEATRAELFDRLDSIADR